VKDEWIVEGIIEDRAWMNPNPGDGPYFVHEVVLYHTNSARIIRAMVECHYWSGVSRDYGDIKKIKYDPRCPRGFRKKFDKMAEDALNDARLAGVM
jgi:hypothetical protein